MTLIHKALLVQDMVLPAGSRVLHGGLQDRQIQIWYETPSPPEAGQPVKISIGLTGQPVPEGGRYVNTFETLMKLIYHVYAHNEPVIAPPNASDLFKS